MSELRIRCRVNGPLVVEGPLTLVDHEGNAFTIPADKPAVALCRCGQSANKPFCDGAHRTCGFVADNLAPRPDVFWAGANLRFPPPPAFQQVTRFPQPSRRDSPERTAANLSARLTFVRGPE